MESLKIFTSRYIQAGNDFLKRSIVFMLFVILSRFIEILWINHFNIHSTNAGYEFYGLIFDFFYAFQITGYLILPYLLLFFLNRNIANNILIVFTSLIVLVYIGLIGYFSNTAMLLGSDLFAYNFHEIIHIVKTSNISILMFLVGFVSLICLLVLTHILFSRIKFHPYLQTALYLIMLESMFANGFKVESKDFENQYNYYLAENKLTFFFKSIYTFYDNKVRNEDIGKQTIEAQVATIDKSLIAHEVPFPEYPFFHKDETPNVLGSFLNSDETSKPNIIFVIVESLGTAYSGTANYLGSFTPFLDSLSAKSLYWNHFMSSAGRTFQVLPTMLGSLPFGETGFNDLQNKMPNHITLPRLLKKDGYSTAFFYGGEAAFDNMDIFLKKQNIDEIVDNRKFDKSFKQMPSRTNGQSWGFGDLELFNNYLKYTENKSSPRMDVLLTLSMHSPFYVQNQADFELKVEQRIVALKLSKEQSQYIRKYKSQFATIMYFDDALRQFVEQLSKRPSFKNTILVITGDHRMPEIPISTQIDRFHVPLVIYSPMLKTAKTFEGVASQFDVTPTFVSLLRNSYGMKFPSYCSWIGFDLDTSSSFRNRHIYPFMRNKNEFFDLMVGDKFLSNTDAYTVDKTFDMEYNGNSSVMTDLTQRFMYFKQINTLACRKNKLLPDSIYSKW